MNKKQKINLTILASLFLLPEILWSSIGNFMYQFFQTSNNVSPFRQNFLDNPASENIYSTILFIQFLSILLFTIYLIVLNTKSKKWSLWLLVIVTGILSVITFFCFGLSVQLRHIGF